MTQTTLAASPRFSSAARARRPMGHTGPQTVLITPLAPADLILVFGCYDAVTGVAMGMKAAELYKAGFAKKILVSGGVPNQNGILEASHIRGVLREMDVPDSAIHLETHSTNTLENAQFSHAMAASLGLPSRPDIILINQRHASLRGVMTMAAQWPESLCMSAPVSRSDIQPHWRADPVMLALMAREEEKIKIYRARGDIADINKTMLFHRIHAVQRKNGLTPSARPSVS